MTEDERQIYRDMYAQTHHVSSVDKIPATSHFVVLQDESRSYPSSYGEQYGNDTCNYMQYITFDSEEALRYWILQQATDTAKAYYRKPYRVFKVNPIEIELQTVLTVKD